MVFFATFGNYILLETFLLIYWILSFDRCQKIVVLSLRFYLEGVCGVRFSIRDVQSLRKCDFSSICLPPVNQCRPIILFWSLFLACKTFNFTFHSFNARHMTESSWKGRVDFHQFKLISSNHHTFFMNCIQHAWFWWKMIKSVVVDVDFVEN